MKRRDDFSFPITNFPFLDCDVPLAPSYGVYISQLVRFLFCTYLFMTLMTDHNQDSYYLFSQIIINYNGIEKDNLEKDTVFIIY
jgi:hypothetical protein